MKKLIVGIVLIGIVLVTATGCMSFERGMKDLGSNMSGLDRTVKVYSYSGELLQTYKGRFDISEGSDGTKIKFDLDGKRIMIYNAIVIVEED